MKKLKNKNLAFFFFLKNYIHPHFDLGFLYKRKKNQAPKILKEKKKRRSWEWERIQKEKEKDG